MYPQRPSAGRLRGRVGELRSVVELLDSAATGHGAILLVDGAPGIGKTRLLAAAEDRATHHGFSLARAHADELPRPLPLAPLFAGLDLAPPGGTRARGPATQGQMLACLEKLAVQTGKLAARGPVLITLDDVQWADVTTIAALRALPTWLAEYPIGWVLLRRMGARDPPIDWLFGEWEHLGASRIALGPLADDAVADVIADVLRARPDSDLLAMAHGAAGNPLLVRALLDGLRDEGGVAIAAWPGTAAVRAATRAGAGSRPRLGHAAQPHGAPSLRHRRVLGSVLRGGRRGRPARVAERASSAGFFRRSSRPTCSSLSRKTSWPSTTIWSGSRWLIAFRRLCVSRCVVRWLGRVGFPQPWLRPR